MENNRKRIDELMKERADVYAILYGPKTLKSLLMGKTILFNKLDSLLIEINHLLNQPR